MTLAEAISRLNGRSSKKVGNNTYLESGDDGAVHLKLHSTRIISWNADGTVKVNSGGWRTVTTKARLNAFLDGAEVFQKNFDWFVMVGGKVIEFEDGMTLPTCK